MSQPMVSVLVVVRNEERYIEQCLQSLVNQDYPVELYEIIVVDGMSTDKTRELVTMMAQSHANIRLIDNPRLVYPSGLNIGIKQARGEVVIKIDGHASAAPDFITQAVKALQQSGAVCVGGPITTLGEGYIGQAIAAMLSSPFGVGNASFRYSQKEGYVSTVPYGAYHKSIFHKVGLFDESLQRVEDLDLHSRIRRQGGKFYFTPKIKSYYYSRITLRGLIRQAFSTGYEVVARPGVVFPRHLVPMAFVLSLVISLVLAIFSLWGKFLFLAIDGTYLIAAIAFSLRLGWQNGGKYIPVLPLTFFLFHFSYGLGSLWSVIRRGRLK